MSGNLFFVKPQTLSRRQVEEVILRAHIKGASGDCGLAAMAINDALLEGRGTYVAAIPATFDRNDMPILDHVGVVYKGIIFDSTGAITSSGLKRFSTIAKSSVTIVNITNTIGAVRATEMFIRYATHPAESYAVKVKKLKAALTSLVGKTS
jgi:hypothetical protein